MKSIYSILFLIIFTSHYLIAQTESTVPTPEDLRNNVYFRANPAIPGRQCPAGTPTKSLSDLEILGKSISEIQPRIEVQGCVMARNAGDAFAACGHDFNIINLANSQYDEDLSGEIYSSTGRVATPFYCIKHEFSMVALKRQRCEELRADPIFNKEFKFRMTFPTGDASCQVQPISAAPGAKWDLHNDRLEELFRGSRLAPPQAITLLSDELLTAPVSIDLSSLPTITIDDADTKINTCIARWRDRANICKSGADEVLQTCSENRAAPAGTVSQATGTQQTLFEAGAHLSATQNNLDRQITSCTEGAHFCTTSCNPDQANQMVADCLRDAGQSSEAQFTTAYPELSRTLQSAKTEVRDLFSEGHQICTAQVPSRKLNLNNILNTVVSAIRAAAVGSCKTSASNSQNCDQIPAIPDCQSNPGLGGCNIYSQMGSCAVGSVYYSAPACACARNPVSCTPQAGNTAGTTSTFGGNLVGASAPQNSGASGSGGGGSGSGGGSFGDLSVAGGGNTTTPANFAGNIKAGEISTGGAATGASVGGGGNGAAGPAGGPEAAVPVAEKGIGALFKDLKNVVTNAFGGGASKTAPAIAKGNGAVNTDRFKPQQGPLRGGPQARDIASANEKTLFELVNECANGLRCKMPGDSYLVNP